MNQESKYAMLKGSEQNTLSYIFDEVPNVPRFRNMNILGF